MGQTFLIVVLVVLMGLILYSLVRGIIAFMQTTKADLEGGEGTGPTASQLTQNKMMMRRIMFQAAAIIVVALILASSGK